MKMNLPVRKYTRLAASNYIGFQFYFVTLCCFGRKKIFADEGLCERVLGLLRSECALRGFVVPAYCAMPDHLHFLCEGVGPGSDFLRLMTSFRIKSSRRFSQENGGVLWQRGYYEHVLRAGEVAELVAWYIWLNPVRQGLVSRAQEYRFAGSFTGWKMPTSWNELGWRPPWRGNGRLMSKA